MAIASLNVNGLRSHLDEVKLLLKDLGIHILALNETKLPHNYPKDLTCLSGYQQERLDRTSGGGGVSIYIRESINYKSRTDIPADDLEIICIEVEPPKSKSFLVLAWYRPPNDPVASFIKLEKVLSFLDKENKEIILLGDTNCDLTQKPPEQTRYNDSKHMLDLYELFSFKQLIEEPTRVTSTTSTLIDHIATTCARNIVRSGVHEISMSDHFMVCFNCPVKFSNTVDHIM
ncbi:MAG: endonuclease/exonuclease/phosphatase family protein, partial [Cyanobacteria bacterium J06555_13]